MSRARDGPSPKTVCVPSLNKWQPRQPSAAARSFESVARGGMKSAAEPVGLAVFLGFVMLLSIFLESVAAFDRAAVDVCVVLPLRCAFGFLAAAVLPMDAF